MASPHTHEACADHNLKRVNQVQRAQWLRAAILGANDGLLSTTALMLGVGAAKEDHRSMILSGLASAFAGACSMAVGEFVSVSTQRDIEKKATIENSSSENEQCGQDSISEMKIRISESGHSMVETKQIDTNLAMSLALTPTRMIPCQKASPAITPATSPIVRSYPKSPVMRVIEANAKAAMSKGEKGSGDEKDVLPNPYKAATASALAFLCGSLIPLSLALFIAHSTVLIVVIVVTTSVAMVLFGGIGAYLGGSSVKVSALRILLGGWFTMGVTYGLLKPLDGESIGGDTEKC